MCTMPGGGPGPLGTPVSVGAEGGATGTGHRLVCMQFTLFHFILVLFLDHRHHRFARNLSDHDLSSLSSHDSLIVSSSLINILCYVSVCYELVGGLAGSVVVVVPCS